MTTTRLEGRTGWDAIHDFMNEIFATIIPGAFFLSFFFAVYFIAVPQGIVDRINDFSEDMGMISSIVIGALIYCFGAIFQRKEIKRLDRLSARYIYRTRPHDSGHSFAFADALTDQYMQSFFYVLRLALLSSSKRDDEMKRLTLINLNEDSQDNEEQMDKVAIKYYKKIVKCNNINQIISEITNDTAQGTNNIDYRKSWVSVNELCKREFKKCKKQRKVACLLYTDIDKIKCDWLTELYNNIVKYFLGWKNKNYNVLFILIKRMKKLLKDDNLELLKKIYKAVNNNLNSIIDWPYTRMYSYCKDRDLIYTDEVDWGDGAPKRREVVSNEIKRSKSRMNTLKMQIAVVNPNLHDIISKTEAHIRFVNSIWYATRLLRMVLWCMNLALTVLTIFRIVEEKNNGCYVGFYKWLNHSDQTNLIYLFIVSFAYLLICWYINRSCLQIMHYQRVRELNMILKAKLICKIK